MSEKRGRPGFLSKNPPPKWFIPQANRVLNAWGLMAGAAEGVEISRNGRIRVSVEVPCLMVERESVLLKFKLSSRSAESYISAEDLNSFLKWVLVEILNKMAAHFRDQAYEDLDFKHVNSRGQFEGSNGEDATDTTSTYAKIARKYSRLAFPKGNRCPWNWRYVDTEFALQNAGKRLKALKVNGPEDYYLEEKARLGALMSENSREHNRGRRAKA